VIINEPFFQRLSEADRAVILKSADEVDITHAQHVAANGERVRSELTGTHGVTFCDLEDAEVWAQRARGIWPDLYELVGGGEEWVNQTIRYMETGSF